MNWSSHFNIIKKRFRLYISNNLFCDIWDIEVNYDSSNEMSSHFDKTKDLNRHKDTAKKYSIWKFVLLSLIIFGIIALVIIVIPFEIGDMEICWDWFVGGR